MLTIEHHTFKKKQNYLWKACEKSQECRKRKKDAERGSKPALRLSFLGVMGLSKIMSFWPPVLTSLMERIGLLPSKANVSAWETRLVILEWWILTNGGGFVHSLHKTRFFVAESESLYN